MGGRRVPILLSKELEIIQDRQKPGSCHWPGFIHDQRSAVVERYLWGVSAVLAFFAAGFAS